MYRTPRSETAGPQRRPPRMIPGVMVETVKLLGPFAFFQKLIRVSSHLRPERQIIRLDAWGGQYRSGTRLPRGCSAFSGNRFAAAHVYLGQVRPRLAGAAFEASVCPQIGTLVGLIVGGGVADRLYFAERSPLLDRACRILSRCAKYLSSGVQQHLPARALLALHSACLPGSSSQSSVISPSMSSHRPCGHQPSEY